MHDRGRRPKAFGQAYNQGDAVLRLEVVPDGDREKLRFWLREIKLDGKMVGVDLDEHELTVVIDMLFKGLLNLQARRQ